MTTKDNFSDQSDHYVRFRPMYPDALFRWIDSECPRHERAWDCGTGNGQLAVKLAESFRVVDASDISEKQLANAGQRPNIRYHLFSAGEPMFEENAFDLVTVAQAIHWFDFDAFYREVYRTLKPDGLFVVTGYGLFRVSDAVDGVIHKLYEDVLGPYWDQERRYIEENYATIPFPFREIPVPEIENVYQWSFNEVAGYLQSWSALQHYKRQTGNDPFVLVADELRACWGDGLRTVRFRVLLRAGVKLAKP